MSKVMIAEDDDSLREIYSIRLTAEGYAVISARDGEEALATAVKERPDLIVSDVMMPKITGFDMLDILRSTPETKNIKVIMMTALSSDDQRQRGENLGADRYLVKSQVGIEDVVNAVHEVLGDRTTGGIITTGATITTTTAPAPQPITAPVPGAVNPVTPPATAATPSQPAVTMPPQATVPATPAQPVAPVAAAPATAPTAPQAAATVAPTTQPAAPALPPIPPTSAESTVPPEIMPPAR